MRNSSLRPYVPAHFSPPEYTVVVNSLLYASLVTMLSRIRCYAHQNWGIYANLTAAAGGNQRAKTHKFRYLGMEYWRLHEVVSLLSFVIQVSLLLFVIGQGLFFFISVNPYFMLPLGFLASVLFTMRPPQPYGSLLPPRLSTLLCRASLGDCINVCMLISAQPLVCFFHQVWILPW